jgi:hypothetical protein
MSNENVDGFATEYDILKYYLMQAWTTVRKE